MSFGVTLLAMALAAGQDPRPRLDISTEEKFEAKAIPAYQGNHEAVYRHIDSHLDHHLEEIRRWLRQPSVSAQSVGIEQMATMVRDDAGAPKTLLVYLMYDVPGGARGFRRYLRSRGRRDHDHSLLRAPW